MSIYHHKTSGCHWETDFCKSSAGIPLMNMEMSFSDVIGGGAIFTINGVCLFTLEES